MLCELASTLCESTKLLCELAQALQISQGALWVNWGTGWVSLHVAYWELQKKSNSVPRSRWAGSRVNEVRKAVKINRDHPFSKVGKEGNRLEVSLESEFWKGFFWEKAECNFFVDQGREMIVAEVKDAARQEPCWWTQPWGERQRTESRGQ